jgi:hypothetical protein
LHCHRAGEIAYFQGDQFMARHFYTEREVRMNINQMNTGRGYWLAWFLASSLGYGIGVILGMFFAYGIFNRDPFDVTMGIALGTVMGATGGYFQWVVLRERIAGASLWGLASALGFGSAIGAVVIANTGENYVMAGIVIGSVFGVVSGILQWLILRRHVKSAGWWVVANLLGSLVSAIAGVGAFTAISATGNSGLGTMMFGLVFGAGNGALTGAMLVWLLRQPHCNNVEGMAMAH